MDPVVNEIKAESPEVASLKDLIKNHAQKLQVITDQLKEKKGVFKIELSNNPSFVEVEGKVKEAKFAEKTVKAEILKEPSMATLDQEIKDLNFDLKETKQTLSDLLVDYRDVSKNTQLTLLNGVVAEISLGAKLKRK